MFIDLFLIRVVSFSQIEVNFRNFRFTQPNLIYNKLQERRRLKERYPSLALVKQDEEQCALMLNNYEKLLLSRNICEGRCAMGEECPTGVCRTTPTRRSRRRSSRSQSDAITRSPSSTSLRPRSGPAGLRSYTGIHFSSVMLIAVSYLENPPLLRKMYILLFQHANPPF